jgi:hypothetical protein
MSLMISIYDIDRSGDCVIGEIGGMYMITPTSTGGLMRSHQLRKVT